MLEESYDHGVCMFDTELDESKGVPLYRQLKDILHSKIMAGEWPVDKQIPTEEELVSAFKVSRSTVRSAIAELTRRGILYRKRGVGTFVLGETVNAYSVYSRNHPDEPNDLHKNLAINVLQPEKELARILQINTGVPTFEFVRLRYVGKDGDCALEKSYIKQSLCPELPDSPPTGSFYAWLARQYGIQINEWNVALEAIALEEEDRKLINANVGSPALLYKRLNLDAQGVPIYYSLSLFPGDRFYLRSTGTVKGWLLQNKP